MNANITSHILYIEDGSGRPVNIVDLVIPLSGGQIFAGATFTITVQMLYKYGFRFGLKSDKKRQIILNMICLICSINVMLSYGFNATRQSNLATNITTLVSFMSVQFALAVLNHNSIIRFSTLLKGKVDHSSDRVHRYCLFLYLLPWIALIPVYLAIQDKWVEGGLDESFNKSWYNTKLYKPVNSVLVILTEVFAIVTDILLLLRIRSGRKKILEIMMDSPVKPSPKTTKKSSKLFKDLVVNYGITWFLIVFDVVLKTLITLGYPLLFDSIVSISAIALRSRANLTFGLQLQNILSSPTNKKKVTSFEVKPLKVIPLRKEIAS